jgi:glucose/arabinose dehydrogenase
VPRRLLLFFFLALGAAAPGACGDDGATTGTSPATEPGPSTPSTPATSGPAPSLDTAEVQLVPVADITGATSVATRAGDDGVWVTEQTGLVKVVRNGDVETALDLTDQVGAFTLEQGLLGLTFSPDGDRLYVYFSRRDGDTELVEYRLDGDSVDDDSARSILIVDKPQVNHNGGQLAFGPDEFLYIGLGDGGGFAGDSGPGHVAGGNAQSLETVLGKILRIDPTPAAGQPYSIPADNPFVAGPAGARPEIWSYGLRNPWRFSFDAETGDLCIADVGQGRI